MKSEEMKCPACGAARRGEARFCPSCGGELPAAKAAAPDRLFGTYHEVLEGVISRFRLPGIGG